MITFDRCRRAACVVLVAVFLVMVPSMATASFSDSQAPTLSVSTDRMETPTNLTGTYRCTKPTSTMEAMQVTFTTFTDAGPTGSTYGYGLALGTLMKAQTTSTTKTVTLSATRSYDAASTTWTVSVQAFLNSWNGGIGSENIICPAGAVKTGTF
jgi:hypothetical protein